MAPEAATARAGGRSSARLNRLRGALPDLLGVSWVVLAGIATLLPALVHGASLGALDLNSLWGLSQHTGPPIRQLQGSDQITLFVPWTTLAWTQVHHGQLPLWNPYSVLGSPLAFNWESAPFSLPSLIGYLFPVRLAYTASLIVSLVIGGTGMYVLGRVLRLGVLGCAMAATVFELSGPFMGLLAWPIAWVMAWAGWLFAATILVVRGRRRMRNIALLALVVALAGYGGEPEGLLLLAISLAAFAAVVLVRRSSWAGGEGPVLRPIGDLLVAGAAGAALFAPLLLPGLQVAERSVRNVSGTWIEVLAANSTAHSLPPHDLTHLLLPAFDGLPLRTSQFFGDRLFYIDTVAYVGAIALALALVGLVARRRRPEVLGFGVVTLVMFGLAYLQPVVSAVDVVPHLGGVLWNRSLLPLAFGVAVLSGIGTDVVVRDTSRTVTRLLGVTFGAVGIALAALWLFGRGQLPAAQASIRAHSFIWPAVTTLSGMAAFGVLTLVTRPGARARPAVPSPATALAARWTAGGLLLVETAVLIGAGAPMWGSSTGLPRPTVAVRQLQSLVGTSVVGFGIPGCVGLTRLGVQPNVNVLFTVDEFAVYDPMTPRAYFTSFKSSSGVAPGFPSYDTFCPAVTTAKLARLYGIEFVLEPAGSPAPAGAVFDRTIKDEDVYRVPDAAVATLSSLSPGGGYPGIYASGTPVAVTRDQPGSLRMVTRSHSEQVLRLRLTNLPGWHASIDGRPLELARFAGVMMQGRIPPGRHTIELHYWPTAFTIGIVLAVLSLLGLVAGLLLANGGGPRRLTAAPS